MVELELYSVRDREVQSQAGLNWNFSDGHVSTCDAYIALTKAFFLTYPDFFPCHGSKIHAIWDDQIEMILLLEGTQIIEGKIYPKQISTYNNKSELGNYIRSRIGVPCDTKIILSDLEQYGKNYVTVTKISEGNYLFDFS